MTRDAHLCFIMQNFHLAPPLIRSTHVDTECLSQNTPTDMCETEWNGRRTEKIMELGEDVSSPPVWSDRWLAVRTRPGWCRWGIRRMVVSPCSLVVLLNHPNYNSSPFIDDVLQIEPRLLRLAIQCGHYLRYVDHVTGSEPFTRFVKLSMQNKGWADDLSVVSFCMLMNNCASYIERFGINRFHAQTLVNLNLSSWVWTAGKKWKSCINLNRGV